MSFDWLRRFHRHMQKPANYAEKTLAAYRLGMRARGAIAGVRIETGDHACADARALDDDAVYHPDEAPHLPLPSCPQAERCPCVYRPVMRYESDDGDEEHTA